MDCIIKEVKNTIVKKATSYIVKDKEVIIPVTPKRDKKAAYRIAEKKVSEVNKKFQAEVFGNVASLNTTYTNGVGIKITIPKSLSDAYKVRMAEMELSDLIKEAERQQREDAERAGVEYDEDYLFDDTSFEPKEEPFEGDIDDSFNFDDLAQDYGYANDTGLENEVISNYDTLIKYKKSLVVKLNDRIANLQYLGKHADTKEDALHYSRLENKLQQRVNQLEEHLLTIESGLGYFEFEHQANEDFKRLEELLESEDIDDVKEASRIVNFYKALSFDTAKKTIEGDSIDSHPIFMDEEIFSDGDNILPEKVINFFEDLASKFKKKERVLEEKQKKVIENIFNSNSKFQQLKGNIEYKDLMKPTEDINWIDMMIMDISKNTFSDSGLIPQMMMSVTQAVFSEEVGKVKIFEQKHNELQVKAEKVLKEMGYGLTGIKVKGVSYELFFQKVLGRNTGRLVHRYAQSFFDNRKVIQDDFKNKIKLVKLSGLEEDLQRTLMVDAYKERQKWYRENTMVFDIRKLREVHEAFEDLDDYFDPADDVYRQELIDNIGEKGYKEEVEKQINLIKKYFIWKETFTESFLFENGVESVEDLDEEKQLELEVNLMSKSPFAGSDYFHYSQALVWKEKFVNPSMEYNISIPRKYKGEVKGTDKEGRYIIENTNEKTGYYDEQFNQIESNDDLYNYYNVVRDEMKRIMDSFPVELQDKLFTNSLPTMRKNYSEILADPNIPFFKKLVTWLTQVMDRIRGGFGVNVEDSIKYDNVDVITGNSESTINTSFLNNNKQKVEDLFTIEMNRINALLKEGGVKQKATKSNSINLYSLPFSVIELISQRTNIPATYEAMEAKFGKRIPIGNIMYQVVTSDLVDSSSTNLPKLIKYFSMMSAEYSARQQLLPYMEMMKNHYKNIKKVETNSIGKPVFKYFAKDNTNPSTDGLRDNANKQVEDWFKRVILGENTSKAIGVSDIDLEDAKSAKEKVSRLIRGRILSSEDKKLKKQLDELLSKETNEKEISKLLKIKAKLGKQQSASAWIDNLLNYIRFLGLGYNLSSGVTNFAEGQIANMIIAATGDHFESHHYYRALNIVKGSFFKSFDPTKSSVLSTKASRKLRVLVDRYNILQDSTNELQKAGVKTPLDQFEKFGPMEINKRTEYLNQTPLMLSVMFDTKITGIDGTVSNPWDAMDENGNLLPNFRTDENVAVWEEMKGEQFTNFKSTVSQAIGMAHGLGYDQLRGMMAKSGVGGRMIMMFKTWVGSQIYTRLATERDDIELGVKGYKGRYRSFTRTSAATMGTVIAATTFGTSLPILAVGYAAGRFFGGYSGVETDMNIIKEHVFLAKAIARKMIGMPINFIGSTFTGKQVMEEFKGYEKLITEGKFTERDAKNLKAIVTEMSLMLTWLALTMITKAALWDDDDDEGSPERVAHNLIVNRLLQLNQSAQVYINFLSPDNVYNLIVGELGFFKFLENVGKVISATQEYMEGNDTITRGMNKGESKLENALTKITLPSLVKDNQLGFGSQMEKQFTKTYYDDWYWDDSKKQNVIIDKKRTQLRLELEKQFSTLSEKEREKRITEILNRKYPRKKDVKDPNSKK